MLFFLLHPSDIPLVWTNDNLCRENTKCDVQEKNLRLETQLTSQEEKIEEMEQDYEDYTRKAEKLLTKLAYTEA